MNKLNLGCGLKKLENYINVDNRALCEPDVLCDLNSFPYPFADNSFSEIILEHLLEHLNNPLEVLTELHRISQPDAQIIIKCPHFSTNWVHPGHKSAISVHLFDFFGVEAEESYSKAGFQVDHLKLRWMRPGGKGKRASLLFRSLALLINFFANLSPAMTERLWVYNVGGFEELEFKVKVIK
ncbi:methyltransferase domain-containing protein [Patescibacteria group bacterium]|nr:methyltransferase domain-containing protein [Patescibacteria group bacterium]